MEKPVCVGCHKELRQKDVLQGRCVTEDGNYFGEAFCENCGIEFLQFTLDCLEDYTEMIERFRVYLQAE